MMLPVERGSGEQKSNLLCAAGELEGRRGGRETTLGGGTADIFAVAHQMRKSYCVNFSACVHTPLVCFSVVGGGGECVCECLCRGPGLT